MQVEETTLKVLIVEDYMEEVKAISFTVRKQWPEAMLSVANSGRTALELIDSQNFDILLLALGLPDMDGMELLRRVRGFSDIPVIIISMRRAVESIVKGLTIGADDYITKPFSPIDLTCRMGAVLRRARYATSR
jgi:DNA-binding response OmpR family regulator